MKKCYIQNSCEKGKPWKKPSNMSSIWLNKSSPCESKILKPSESSLWNSCNSMPGDDQKGPGWLGWESCGIGWPNWWLKSSWMLLMIKKVKSTVIIIVVVLAISTIIPTNQPPCSSKQQLSSSSSSSGSSSKCDFRRPPYLSMYHCHQHFWKYWNPNNIAISNQKLNL